MLPINPLAVVFFASNNIRLTPLNALSKAPLEKDWTTKTYTIEELLAKYPQGADTHNLGLVTGNGTTDIDLDIPSHFLPFAPSFLPPSDASFGRRSKPRSHYLYHCTDDAPFQVLRHGTMAIEFRSDAAHQTMVPPSMHPSGELVEWATEMRFGPLPKVSGKKLLQGARLYMAACILADSWPSGNRHFASMALTGMLIRINEVFPDTFPDSSSSIVSFVTTVAKMAGDDEPHDRKLAATDTVEKWASGGDRKVTGGPSLELMIGKDTVAAVRRLLTNDDTFERVEDFNRRFATLILGNKPAVLHESDVKTFAHGIRNGLRVKKADLWSVDAFKMDTAHEQVDIVNAKGEMKRVPFATLWLKHPARRHFNKGIDFTPPPEFSPPECYNLFRGFQFEPRADASKIERFLEHIHENVAGGDDKLAHWVTAFFADIIQDPANRPGTALVLQGETGTGKTIMTDIISSLISPYGVAVNTHRHLVGHFNSHLSNALLVAAHEALYAGDKAHAGALKAIITDPWVNIERKGYDSVQQRNYMRLVITTNEQWVVPASFQERRFMVLEMNTKNKQNLKFFGAMIDEMGDGGYEALMHYLLHYKYSKSDITRIPTTDVLVRQQELSESPVMVWWKERLEVGEPLGLYKVQWATHGSGTWPEWISKEALYKDYCVWAEGQRWSSKSQSIFWVDMRRLFGLKTATPLKQTYITKARDFNSRDGMHTDKARIMYVQMPTLEEARNIYEKVTSSKVTPIESDEDNVISLAKARDK